MKHTSHAQGAATPATGPTNEAAVLRTLEQYPLQHRAAPTLPHSAQAAPSRLRVVPPPTQATAPLDSARTAPVPLHAATAQAVLDQRVHAEVTRRLYDLLNQQLQARQQDLVVQAQQQAAMERAAAAALLGRPTRSPSPPPPAAAVASLSGPIPTTRSGRRAVGLACHTADAAGAAPHGSARGDVPTADLSAHRLVHERPPLAQSEASRAAVCNDVVDDDGDDADAAENGFVASVRDRVRQFRYNGRSALNGMDLVRVKRLRAVPNHNRGLFAGLDGSPWSTRSGHLVVGRRRTEDGRVRSGAWYRLLKHTADASDTPSSGALGITGTGTAESDSTHGPARGEASSLSAGGHHARYSDSHDGPGADSSMVLKAYGSKGEHGFIQLLPGHGTGARPSASNDSGSFSSGKPGTGGRASLAEDLQRILDERYGHALTPEEREAAKERVREYRKKGPRDTHSAGGEASSASTHTADGAGETGDDLSAQEAAGQWTLPALSGDGEGHLSGALPNPDGTSGQTGPPAAGGRHSFDHTMNSTEARRYDSTQTAHHPPSAATGAGSAPHGAGTSDPSAGVVDGTGARSTHTPGLDDDTRETTSTRLDSAGSAAARPHTAHSRPSTTSLGPPHLNDLSATNVLAPPGRPTTGLVGGHTAAADDAPAHRGTTNAPSSATSAGGKGTAGLGGKPGPGGKSQSKTHNTASSRPTTQRQPSLELLTDSDNEEDLELFLAHFPETEDHVMLRKEANGMLADFPDYDNMGWSSASDGDGLTDATREAQRQRRQRHLARRRQNGQGSDDENEASGNEPLAGFDVDHARLRSKFLTEADEEFEDLVAQRDRLLAEVRSQRTLIGNFQTDVFHLSKGQAGVATGDKFAIELTREVNAYAKTHHLRLNDIDLSAGAHSMEEVAEGFLDHFGKVKSTRRTVGTQVTDKDLGYADEGVRSAEAMLEDLVFHERGLMESIRLATVAIANIMSFHASLELESTCKECFYLYENPRTLWPCGHTFCQQCLSGMYNRNDELICAECGSLCEVGYTPNLSIELVANYQTVQEAAESPMGRSFENASTTSSRAHGTIELVLRRLLNDLLTVQRNYSPGEPPLFGTAPA